ncbi:MAG TPA: hypothetical protein VHL79_14120 [Ramlibacter sp.]|jgi:hypothetical protein|nr:hypothetical protein [Ramlibacter sp.]
MRRLLLLVMIALLPLRLWAADGMALQMAQAQLAASTVTAEAAAPHDCHTTMAAAPTEAGSEHESDSAAGHCFACHLCAAGVAAPLAAAQGRPASTALPLAPASRFASAEHRLVRKPPIA